MKKVVNRILVYINIILFFWSFLGERILCFPENINSHRQQLFYILIKISTILLLILLYKFITYIIFCKWNEEKVVFITCFIIMFLIYSLLFFVVYPGVWNNDTISMVQLVRVYNLAGISQSLLTFLFMGTVLSLIPNVAAIPFIQIFLICMISSYIAMVIYSATHKRVLVSLVMVIEFLPLMIVINMFPLRTALYAHVWILLLTILWKECIVDEGNKLSFRKGLLIGLLSGIAGSWRFEGFFIIFISGIILLCLKKQSKSQKIISLILPVIVYLFIGQTSSLLLRGSTFRGDISKAMCTSLSLMLQEDLNGTNAEEYLTKIDRIMDLEIVREHPNAWYPEAINACRNDCTQTEFYSGIMAYGKLVITNFDSYLVSKYQQYKILESWDFIGYNYIGENELVNSFGIDVPEINKDEELEAYKISFEKVRGEFLTRLYHISGIDFLDNILIGISPTIFIVILSLILSVINFRKYKIIFIFSTIMIIYFSIFMAGMAMAWPAYLGAFILGGMMIGILLLATYFYEQRSLNTAL